MAWNITLKSKDCQHRYVHNRVYCTLDTDKYSSNMRCSQKNCPIKQILNTK